MIIVIKLSFELILIDKINLYQNEHFLKRMKNCNVLTFLLFCAKISNDAVLRSSFRQSRYTFCDLSMSVNLVPGNKIHSKSS